MSDTVTAAEMKALDSYTIEVMGVPSMVLMERAALAAVEVLDGSDFDLAKVLCVCGTGNNGGDGLAIARLLLLKGIDAEVLLVGDGAKCSVETKEQMTIARNYGVSIYENDLKVFENGHTTMVDALFGIGGNRPIAGKYADVIERQNNSNADILAVDIPSGISADTGEILGTAIRAKATATFAFNKVGLTISSGKEYAGKVTVKDIGIYRK
ncbi:MAG: NAD(P)H-hydrate epimerase [Clostridiales Family XIII bacterium]|jgi:NAD(P)H-hydrate epimerase|nr:NAD(P)H-hydrate epimerase [Clostridiales Family XIII bacterium]